MGQLSTALLVILFVMGALMVAAALGESRALLKEPRRSPGRRLSVDPIVVPQVV
ncbi:hypothetical protein ACFXI0_09975 [Kitasatospora indigofera]|uniref:hypothetical protein n=1 Tax=Kitasatospora indigofera TaxID=67307 RepID=UPI0036B6856D